MLEIILDNNIFQLILAISTLFGGYVAYSQFFGSKDSNNIGSVNNSIDESELNTKSSISNNNKVSKVDSDLKINKIIEKEDLNDPKTQNMLGLMYFDGDGIIQDKALGIKWLEKSAFQGNSDAQHLLGYIYMEGDGTKRNHSYALSWTKKAVKNNHPKAKMNLGIMYMKGLGVEQNSIKAFQLIEESANQGYVKSQFYLGCLLQEGIEYLNNEKNTEKGYEWIKKAADQGHKEAQYILAMHHLEDKNNDFLHQTIAASWLERASDQGHSYASYKLSELFKEGVAVEKSIKKSLELKNLAAEQGHEMAKIEMLLKKANQKSNA